MIKEKKSIILLIWLVLFGMLILYLPYLVNKVPFEVYTIDTREQFYIFYEKTGMILHQLLKTGAFSLYEFTDFLGNNFVLSKLFFYEDIFSIVFATIGINFWDHLLITQIIKCVIASVGMYLLLSEYNLKPWVKIIGGISFAFSSGMSYFAVYPSFTTFMAFVPLYLYSLDRLIKYKKKTLFIVLVTFLAISNYYFFFLLSFFTVIYVIFRYLMLYGTSINKNWLISRLKETGKLIIYYLIGVLMASFVLVPIFFFITLNSRVGSNSTMLLYKDINVYLQSLASFILPLHSFRGITYPFLPGGYNMHENFLWVGSAIVASMLLVFIRKRDNIKKASIFALICIACVMFIPFISSIAHGFSEPSFRITIIFEVLLIIIGCIQIDTIKELSVKHIGIYASIIALILVFIFVYSSNRININLSDCSQAIIIALVSFLFIVLFMYLFKNIDKKYSSYIIIGCIFIEMIGQWGFALTRFYKNDERHSYAFMEKGLHVLQDNGNDLATYLNNLEEANSLEYYRVYYDEQSIGWDISRNLGLIYNINSVSTYDSLYNPNIQKFTELVPDSMVGSAHYLTVTNGDALNFLGVKYAIVTNEDQLPKNVSWELMTDEYRENISIYRNADYISIGKTYDKVKTYNEYADPTDLNEYIICNEEDYEAISKSISTNIDYFENVRYEDNHIFGTIEAKSRGFMVLSIPYDSKWNLSINGLKTDVYSVDGGFIGFDVPEGNSSVELYYSVKGYKEGIILSIIGFACFILIIIKDKKRLSKV